MKFHNDIRVLNYHIHSYDLNKFLPLPYKNLNSTPEFRSDLMKLAVDYKYLFDDHMKAMCIDRKEAGGLKLTDLDVVGRRYSAARTVLSELNPNIKKEIIPMVQACQFWLNLARNENVNAPLIMNDIEEKSSKIRELVLSLTQLPSFLIRIQELISKTVRAGFRSDNQEEFLTYQAQLKEELSQSPYYETDFKEKLSELNNEYPNIIRQLTRQFERLHEIIVDTNPQSEIASMADRYCHLMNKSETLSHTVESYQLKSGENCIVSIELSDNRKIPEIIYFKDNSVSYKESGQYLRLRNKEELALVLSNVEDSCIHEMLKNRPKIAKFFIDKHDEEKLHYRHSFHKVETVIKSFIKNEDILKNSKLDYTLFKDKDFEAIDDHINQIVYAHKVKAYANSIFSNKYKHLMNEESLGYFKELYDLDFPAEKLQKNIGSKIAAIKTQEDFTFVVKKLYDSLSGFNYEAKKTLAEDLGAREVVNDNGVLVLEIENYEQSRKLGSSSWCIVRDAVYFDEYVRNGSRQFFIYDFSKKEIDNDSLIGITLDKDGYNLFQHFKDDTSINYGTSDFANSNSRLGQIHQQILRNGFKPEEINDNYKKVLETLVEQKPAKQKNMSSI
jgi:hypothetical protein